MLPALRRVPCGCFVLLHRSLRPLVSTPTSTPSSSSRPVHHYSHHNHKRSSNARLVLNHSTHLDGLLPTLRRVIEALPPPKLATVVPGRIAVCRGKAAHFRVRISCPTPQGHKGIARKGQTAQEVFFTGTVDQQELQLALDEAARLED